MVTGIRMLVRALLISISRSVTLNPILFFDWMRSMVTGIRMLVPAVASSTVVVFLIGFRFQDF